MQLLALGYEYNHKDAVSDSFRSAISCLDFDAVLWDPTTTIDEYSKYRDHLDRPRRYQGLPVLSDHDSARLQQDIKRRRQEFEDMLRLGKPIVVITSPQQLCAVDSGEREYSGTGKNRVATRLVENIDVLSALPIEFATVPAEGTNLTFRGGAEFKAFWQRNKDRLYYRAYFVEAPGNSLIVIKGTDRAVASLVRLDNSFILFLPPLVEQELTDLEEEARGIEPDRFGDLGQEYESDFIASIIELLDTLTAETGDFSLPSWVEQYETPGEAAGKSALAAAEAQVQDLLTKVNAERVALAGLQERKLLFTGTGKALESQVKSVFEALGCEAVAPEGNRDDLIVTCGDRVAVVEIKGVSKTAAEKHAAQLEKWVSTYFEEHGIQPKGVLVVNAHRDIPLGDRPDAAFPDQMLPYSERRGHCLITGLQLLGIWLAVQEDPNKRPDILTQLFETDGFFQDFADWTKFLSTVTPVGEIVAAPEAGAGPGDT